MGNMKGWVEAPHSGREFESDGSGADDACKVEGPNKAGCYLMGIDFKGNISGGKLYSLSHTVKGRFGASPVSQMLHAVCRLD